MIVSRTSCALLVIDVQERLLPKMNAAETMVRSCRNMMEAARLAEVPVIVLEQNPEKLGATHPLLIEAKGNAPVIPKMAFSAMRENAARARIDSLAHKSQVILCGIEAHICVLQTALDLRKTGIEVYVAADAVTSRSPASMRFGFDRMRDAGISVVTTEMVIFEWAGRAGTDLFRNLAALVR